MRPLNISADDAEDYYYEKDPFFGINENSQWQGQLAKEMDLQGKVDEAPFINLINGNDLNGRQVVQDGVSKKGKTEHRAGIDIPLAAPKSVSIMALHCSDNRLIDAHKMAVAATVDYIEKNFIFARKTKNGKTQAIKTGKGLFAKFTHSTSRANDPHLHTHTFTINMTDTSGGVRALYNDQLFKYQTLLNSIYQSYLAKNVRSLGYGINLKRKGMWEIAGVKDEWIDLFSKRKGEIDSADQLLHSDQTLKGVNEAKVRDMAQRSSRKKKDPHISKNQLLKLWQDQVPRKTILKRVEDKKRSIHDIKLNETDIIRTAYNAVHESESTFKKPKIVDIALRLSRGKFGIDQMEQAFDQLTDEGELQHLMTFKNKLGVPTKIFTSAQMRRIEEGIVSVFNAHKDDLKAVLKHDIEAFLNQHFDYLNREQRCMVDHILTSASRFSIIQGDAGTGKTTAIKALKNFIDVHNDQLDDQQADHDSFISPARKIEIIGLGFTGKTSKELTDKSGIKSFTLHKFLANISDEDDNGSSCIWIVDESSMVGSYQLDELMKAALKKNAKLVLMGDGKQLQAIGAGKMFKDLQRYGHITPLFLKTVLRQKTEHLKQVVGYVSNYMDGDDSEGIHKAAEVLRQNEGLIVIEQRDERLQKIVDQYLDYEDRNDCLIVTPLNNDRTDINQIIHDRLMTDVQNDGTDLQIKVPVSMIGTDRYFAMNYEVGHQVFVGGSNINGIGKGQQFTISDLDHDRNTITIKDHKDDEFVIDLKNNDLQLSVYENAERTFCTGDKIVFTKNDELIGVQNGLTATIERISESGMMTVAVDDTNKRIKFNPYQFSYFDYGYCITGHKAQGQTTDDLIFVTSSDCCLNNSEMFYVALTRAKNNAYLYIDDSQLLTAFEQPQFKSSVIESLHQPLPNELQQTERRLHN